MIIDTKLPKRRERTQPRNPNARCCWVCGREGGSGMTFPLQSVGYHVPVGQIGYAHADCIMKLRKKIGDR